MGGTEQDTDITKVELAFKLPPDDAMDANFMRVKAILTKAKSYDVGKAMALYPIESILDF